MRNYGLLRVVTACGALWAGGLTTLAQERPAGGERRSFMGLINVDSLVDNYANFLARKYNLNPEQDEFTHQLLREKAHLFWDRNEAQLSTLMDRMFDVRTGGDMAPEELIQWGKSVLPLYNEAKGIIVDGNSEWREILTDEQRKIHDEDLRLMEQSFRTTDEQMERIVTGTMTVEEFRSPSRNGRNRQSAPPPPPPPPQPVVQDVSPDAMSPERAQKLREHEEQLRQEQEGLAPPPEQQKELPADDEQHEGMDELDPEEAERRAKLEAIERERIAHEQAEKAAQGALEEHPAEPPPPPHEPAMEHQPQPPPPPPPGPRDAAAPAKGATVSKGFEGEWEEYTRKFIERYQLNQEQSQRANAILADCKEQGVRHMNAKKLEIERLDARVVELQGSKDAAKSTEMAALNKRRQTLMEPLGRIFEQQLKPRLDKLPTRAQRDAAEAAAKNPPRGPAVRPAPGAGPAKPGLSPAGSAGGSGRSNSGKP